MPEAARNPPVVSIDGLRQWATAVVALDAPGLLPVRVALVPSEAHAHALRVELLASAPRALAGTRFLTAVACARAVLDKAGISYQLAEEARRPLRLRRLLRTPPRLASYRVDDLRTVGWEEAFASTILQLEAGDLRPDHLDALAVGSASDLAAIWRALDDDAGSSWSTPRALAEACAVLAAGPAGWPFEGPVLAVAAVGIDAVHARFLLGIPRVTLGVVHGRPARTHAIERIRTLLGASAADSLAAHVQPASRDDELGILSDFLFEPPSRLAAPTRRRSRGPDASVALELHAGVADELDAAARWVATEVFDHRTPLQDIAVLVPTPDPLATLVTDRILALPWPARTAPVYLACGRPAVATAAGARLLAIVRALESFLSIQAMAEILPRMRLAGGDGHLSPGKVRSVLRALGTIGGSPERPRDALRWRDRLSHLEPELGIGPSIDALVTVAADVIGGAALDAIWSAIRALVASHVVAPRDLTAIVDQLQVDLAQLTESSLSAEITGIDAVELIATRLRALRLDSGRFGDPSIYVGTVAGAAGLSFAAVRVLGLAEGAFPGTVREDPVLPAELRRRLPAFTIVSNDDFATARLHALDQVVRGARNRLVLSAPRTDIDGIEREPAALFIEAAAALARPDSITGEPAPAIPNVADLQRDAFRPARAAMVALRTQTPLTPACWLDRAGVDASEQPREWSRSIVTDPSAILDRHATMHGELGPLALTASVAGIQPQQPLSAGALGDLLACPHRFLLERVLRFRPRASHAESHRIEPLEYGALFHRVMEQFSRTYGAAFGSRTYTLDHWLQVADDAANVAFDALLAEYPLVGDGAIDAERRRLRRDVRTLVDHDWDRGKPRTFVDVERIFGERGDLSISTSVGPLFVTGRIDRLDVEDGRTLVRDLKTGRAHPRERDDAEPTPALDLQLALYAAVAEHLARDWVLPADVAAAYVYVDPLAVDRERSFRADRDQLMAAGQRWFDLALTLIQEHRFVQTPDSDDCRYCPFLPTCGDHAADASKARLRDTTGSLALLRELKA